MKIIQGPLRLGPKFYEMIRLALVETEKRLIKTGIATADVREYLNGCRLIFSARPISSLGVAKPHKNCIALNARLLEIYPEKTLTIIAHEVCHLLAFKFHGDRGHGKPWRTLMLALGFEPRSYYTLDASKLRRRRGYTANRH